MLAFVTGSTGLLGNNLVRELLRQGIEVRALARSREKAARQFAGLPVEIVEGDLQDIGGFAAALQGCDALFHTAAFFRDNYKGGSHWSSLKSVNVDGTAALLEAAWKAGIRKAVHTSSIAVLDGPPGQAIDETMERLEENADDYYRSKILSDRAVFDFLKSHPDMSIPIVLPGWMFGPGDLGPTSSGQVVLDFVRQKLPGRIPGSFSIVDARDVARIEIAALLHGQSGRRYLAAGRHMNMDALFPLLEQVSGVPAPERQISLPLLKLIALANEVYGKLTGRPILLSNATVRLIEREQNRTHFDHARTVGELKGSFRPVRETLWDVVDWYRRQGLLQPAASPLARPA